MFPARPYMRVCQASLEFFPCVAFMSPGKINIVLSSFLSSLLSSTSYAVFGKYCICCNALNASFVMATVSSLLVAEAFTLSGRIQGPLWLHLCKLTMIRSRQTSYVINHLVDLLV